MKIDERKIKKLCFSQSHFKKVMLELWNGVLYENYRKEAIAIAKLFEQFPKNDDYGQVRIKVVALNSLYSTNIYKTRDVADHIIELCQNEKLDSLLERGDENSVALLRHITLSTKEQGHKPFNFYSFATKYCHLHNQEAFPIYDSFVQKILKDNTEYSEKDMKDYDKFKKALEYFKKKYSINADVHDLDLYLWIVGRGHYRREETSIEVDKIIYDKEIGG